MLVWYMATLGTAEVIAGDLAAAKQVFRELLTMSYAAMIRWRLAPRSSALGSSRPARVATSGSRVSGALTRGSAWRPVGDSADDQRSPRGP